MKHALAATALFLLAACGNPVSPGNTANPEQAADPGEVVLGVGEGLPDWLLVARQRSCAPDEDCPRREVMFNQRSITRRADGTADIWIQVRHGVPQLYRVETETTVSTVRYDLERLHYRFNCQTQQFMVVERHIMGAGETVIARDEPRQIYRTPVSGSITPIIMPIACRGS
ncbi:MAG: hypothetical protein K2P58_12960 [Hyphomonadaceae bacterium]|nr:hypothetical protein [Hyphomonadaceae bacterium]